SYVIPGSGYGRGSNTPRPVAAPAVASAHAGRARGILPTRVSSKCSVSAEVGPPQVGAELDGAGRAAPRRGDFEPRHADPHDRPLGGASENEPRRGAARPPEP